MAVSLLDALRPSPRAQYEIWGPTEAQSVLDQQNTRNRSLHMPRVQRYAGDMIRGDYIDNNGQTFVFGVDDLLDDGQHRMAAIVMSKTTHRILTVRNAEDGAQATIDHGRARTLGDTLKLDHDVPYNHQVAAAIRALYAYKQIGIPLSSQLTVHPTDAECISLFKQHRDIVLGIDAGGITSRILSVSVSQKCVLYHLFASADQDDADQFFTLLYTGEGLGEGNPIYTLRHRLIRNESQPHKLAPIVVLAFVVRTWNNYRNGVRVTKLQWKAGGYNPDRFPAIDGCTIERGEDNGRA